MAAGTSPRRAIPFCTSVKVNERGGLVALSVLVKDDDGGGAEVPDCSSCR